jgi:hypothetical protein
LLEVRVREALGSAGLASRCAPPRAACSSGRAACATIRALPFALSVARGSLIRLGLVVLGDAESARERVELEQLLLVFQTQLLLVVEALGLGDEEPALEELKLDAKTLVRCTQVVALLGDSTMRIGY